jgi:soluble lytic murein transglycosylase
MQPILRIGRLAPALIVGAFLGAAPDLRAAPDALAAVRACTGACARTAAARAPEPFGPDEAFVAARTANARGDGARLEQAAAQVGADHPLRAYVDYWRLRVSLAESRIDGAGPVDDDARAFVARHAGTLVGDLARRDWLLSLGRRQAWAVFDEVYPGWVLRDDASPRCFALHSRIARGEAIMAEARDLLMAPRELGEACAGLLAAAASLGQASPADLWQRFEAALESGSATAVRRAALLAEPTLDARQLDQALARPAVALAGAPGREIALVAIATLARSDPAQAAERLAAVAPRLRAADRSFAWSQIAAHGMRKLMPEAHGWTREARAARPSDETLAWMARAALRAHDWPTVRSVIERMSDAARGDPTWTYWLGRSLLAQADRPEAQHQARVLFTSLVGRHDFYSQLAAEELGLLVTVPPRAAPPTAEELAAARAAPGFARALKFYELGLRSDGNREWNFEVRTMDDRQLLAAAEVARQRGQLDRAVNAAERTRDAHDFEVRYPAPFADRLKPIARAQGLDPAWVYGLIRQESRFVADARSPVGASGLMQIMPATARWIAKKMGVRDFVPSQITELDTNLQFGSFYLKTVFDGLDQSPVMASAAYNAGPGRPRSWRGTLPQAVEGAIFAEIVPFTETRGYVKHVLSNTAWYAALFTGTPQSLKAMLGEVTPGPAVAPTASPDGN